MAQFLLGSSHDRLPFTSSRSDFQYPVSSYCVEEVSMMKQDDGNPDFWALIALVLSAVLEVVVVSLPGYLLARMGKFDPETQKFVSGLNMMVFTPCLIFTKIASQLSPDKLAELMIIPVVWAIQVLVSAVGAFILAKVFRLHKRGTYFVIAMAVFGNSNSLPISIIVSLSKTLPNLIWDKLPGDNPNEVAARGILYLLVNQQLGQIIRWTVGYKILLKKPSEFKVSEGGVAMGREENGDYSENSLIGQDESDPFLDQPPSPTEGGPTSGWPTSGTVTPQDTNGHAIHLINGQVKVQERPINWRSPASISRKLKSKAGELWRAVDSHITAISHKIYEALPSPLQAVARLIGAIYRGVIATMTAPLVAMIIAVFVAATPTLQHHLFKEQSFINTSVVRAIEQSSGVAVPLILVVLGANLGHIPEEDPISKDPELERKLVWVSLLARMVFPALLCAPLLVAMAKYVPVSIVDDPVFVVVQFLLIGAPTALQLTQICQINDSYPGVMAKILFQSYVVFILPSTLILVVAGIETVKWAEK